MPASLNCPTCGAPAPSADAARCEYCGSTLSSIACPKCFGPMFAGMEFCPSCGAKAARAVDGEGAVLPCPGCKGDMRPVRIGETDMHECSGCSSLWVEGERFRQLCAARTERGAVKAFLDSTVPPNESGTMPSPAAGTVVRYVPCPICHKVMNRENFGHRSTVIIDVCKAHGVWFERNELQAALAFIDSGDFERARQAFERGRSMEDQMFQAELEKAGEVGKIHYGMHIEITTSRENRAGAPDSWLDRALRSLFS